MDFLNKAMAQVADLFRSMTPGARITAGLLLAVVIVSLGYLFNNQMSGGDLALLGGQSFSAGELSAMEAAFGKAGLNGYEMDGNRIRIPRGQQAAYMAALADHGALPAHFGDYLINAVGKMGPFTTGRESEITLQIAKLNELGLIIRSMQGVEQAAVHYDTERKSGFRKEVVATASVSVKPSGSHGLEEQQVRLIRHLVAGAFAGLSAGSVTVADLSTGRTWTGEKDGSLGPDASDDPYIGRMKAYQTDFENKIYRALSYVPGVTVTANVELNKELRVHQEKDAYDPKSVVPVMTREESTTTTSKQGGNGGRPGFATNQGNSAATLQGAATGSESNEERSSNETQNAPSRDRTTTDTAGLTPKRVTVSVGVPTSYFESIWRQRNPTPAGQPPAAPEQAALDLIQKEETEKIRSYVTNIIPPSANPADAAVSLVTVTPFQNVISPAISGPPITAQALAWLGSYWSTLGLMGLVMFSLLVLRSLAKNPAANLPELPQIFPAAAAIEAAPEVAQEGAAAGKKPKGRFRRRLGSGPSLREELVEIVREDPDAAANILRGWIAG